MVAPVVEAVVVVLPKMVELHQAATQMPEVMVKHLLLTMELAVVAVLLLLVQMEPELPAETVAQV
jgi:hypothetical protein